MKHCTAFFVILLLLLTGCTQTLPKEVGQDVIMYTQLKTVCEYEKLESACAEKIQIDEFCEEFKIKQYKITFNKETQEKHPYTVCKTTEGLYLCDFTSDFTLEDISKIVFSPIENYKAVINLQIGMNCNEAYSADPTGYFPFRALSLYYVDQFSVHSFENGICFIIFYHNDVITRIETFTV